MDQIKQIIKMASKGLGYREIGAVVGVSRRDAARIGRVALGLRRASRGGTFDAAKCRKLYDAGLNDVEIAQQLKCCHSDIWTWRRVHGLEPQDPVGELQKRAADLVLSTGRSYSSVAKELGLTRNAVAGAVNRAKQGGRKYKKPCSDLGKKKIDDVKAMALYKLGAGDRQIAAVFGASESGVRNWRCRYGLPAQSRR